MVLQPLSLFNETEERRTDAFALLRQLRSIRAARLAQQGADEIALNQPAPRQPFQSEIPTSAPPPTFLQNLQSVIQNFPQAGPISTVVDIFQNRRAGQGVGESLSNGKRD